MKITTSLFKNIYLLVSFTLGSCSVFAGIIFDGSLGTAAPPPVVGTYVMTPFPLDSRPLFNTEFQVDVPANCPKTLDFSAATNHRRVVPGGGWLTWSHGYTGDVYFVQSSQTMTISLPIKTNAFYCYVEPNILSVFTVEASANDGTTSGPINVNGASGATGFAFYTTGACNLTSVTITVGAGSLGFGVGEFGINIDVNNGALSCKNINVSLDAICQATITPEMILTGVYNCYDAFEVNLSHYGVPISNPIDSHYLGQHIIASVVDRVSGNSCWSDLLIEDKLAPVIVCRADTTDCYLFNHDFPLNYEGQDCSHYSVKTIGERVEHFECNRIYLKAVYRDILITDYNGQTDQCTDTILVKRISYEDINLPSKERTLYCDKPYKLDANGLPSPLVTGVPKVQLSNGKYLSIWPLNILLDCNLLVSYEDLDLGEINCVRKIMRTWTVREWWCNREFTQTQLQIIIIKDTKGPEITHAPYSFSATTGRRSCEAQVLLPPIEAVDACHNKLRIDVAYPGGILLGQNGGYANLPVGEDTIFYRVYDGCYNLTEYWIIVTVKDETEPVAVCDRNTVVALNHSGFNWVAAEVFDDGSFDECKLHHFEVRRMDPNTCGTRGEDDWGPEVGFCCEDVGKRVMVGFKAIDHSGNEAICMVNVEVQDKDKPLISCPPHIIVDCRFDIDYEHLEVFGKVVTEQSAREKIVIDPNYWHEILGHPLDGLAEDNCPPTIVETVDHSNVNQCGVGHIVRWFHAEDLQGNQSEFCHQIIYIINHDTFDIDDIDFPDDYETSGICDPEQLIPERLSYPYNKPVVKDDECSLVGYSYHDVVFSATVPGDPCFKIQRTWKVIDWCQRDVYGNVIIWTDTQYIKVTNFVDPKITRITKDTVICSYDINCRPIPVSFSIEATDDCTDPKLMLYTYKIDLDSDGTIDVIRAGVGENVAQGTWPIGKHLVKWEVEDRCGNTAKASFTLDLRNCKAPVAYCLNGLSTSLTPMDLDTNGIPDTALDTIWAKDFDAGSYHNCRYEVKLSFSADTNNTYRVYTCDSLGKRDVELWVTDVNGNTAFCRTFIIIQDNSGFCPTSITNSDVEGLVSTESTDGVQNVSMELLNSGMQEVKTDYSGKYAFTQIPNGKTIQLMPSKKDNWLNGVSTADIVKIQRHILGLEPLTSPYKMIAADVNKSRSITSKDVSDLRRLILGVISEIPSNTSWRFVHQQYSFNDVNNTLNENFPESYEINPLNSDMQLDFYAIKIGDINESAVTKGFQGNQNRSRQVMELQMNDAKLSKDEIQDIEFRVLNGSQFEGMQFTLQWDIRQLDIEGVETNSELKIRDDNFSMIHSGDGKLTFSWNGQLKDGDWIMKLKIKAKCKLKMSEALFLNSAITPAVSVVKESSNSGAEMGLLEEGQVVMSYRGMLSDEFVVLQNEPNPWTQQTNIGLLLPQNGTVNLSIYDLTGKIYLTETRNMNKGYNEFILNKSQLPGSGVYYYQVDYQSNTVTKKMVITE